ncbi:MAG: SoxR reducing system RseC family protein [Candidatus Omnitrophota bacterium]
MKEEGIVIKLDKKSGIIEISPREACTKCCSCGASKPRRVVIPCDKLKGIKEGDTVEIEIKTASMMKVYLILYAMPLAFFAASIFISYAATRSPLVSFFIAIAATGVSYALAAMIIRKTPELSPNICRGEVNV